MERGASLRFQVSLAARAAEDLRLVFVYYFEHFPAEKSVQLEAALLRSLNALATAYYRYPLYHGKMIRRALHRPYWIYYRVDERRELVTVTRIHHGSRSPIYRTSSQGT